MVEHAPRSCSAQDLSNDPSWAPSRAPSDDELAQLPTNLPVARLVLTTTDGGTGVDAVTWRSAWVLLISRPDDADRVAVRTALKRSRELMASRPGGPSWASADFPNKRRKKQLPAARAGETAAAAAAAATVAATDDSCVGGDDGAAVAAAAADDS